MQRLFSTFPCGLPGAGLVLLRLAVAVPLLITAAGAISSGTLGTEELLLGVAGAMVLVGLWTPIAGGFIALAEFWLAWSHPPGTWLRVQSGVVAAAVTMLGPGGCSIDARLFGRRQIEIPER